MRVIGKDIGTAIEPLHEEITTRLREEASSELRVERFEGGAFSNVEWEQDAVVIALHNGVPSRALTHVYGVALQHVRQRLDHYPAVVATGRDFNGGDVIRTTLRELVMAPEAEDHLRPLDLDTAWELEQRHEGLKQLIREAPEEWNNEGTFGYAFSSLQYARFALEHPPELWAALVDSFRERLAPAAELGVRLTEVVQEHGWSSADACIASLTGAREALQLEPFVEIEDMREGSTD
ncbi:MAG: hypothetical protein WD734_06295 [Dehalococcoidia bacterium]